jgi:uroporphyrinogen-III synthase
MATQPIYLLVTGPLPAELIEEAAAKGIVLDTMDFIAIETVIDAEMGAGIRVLSDQQLTAVFTSTNAVEAVKRWMDARRGRSRERPISEAGAMSGGSRDEAQRAPGWRIFCIEGATRRAVADYFGEAAIAGTAESATALAKVVAGEGDENARGTKEIFFFCGDQRREELPAMLRAKGFEVNEWIVYRTLLTPRKAERAYAGIAFFSPSAVESYFSLNTVADDVTLFAIGRTTAAAIQAKCPNAVIISDRPVKEALVRTMTDYFQTNNKE